MELRVRIELKCDDFPLTVTTAVDLHSLRRSFSDLRVSHYFILTKSFRYNGRETIIIRSALWSPFVRLELWKTHRVLNGSVERIMGFGLTEVEGTNVLGTF